ncbi:MAG: PilZ domain-containing protein [Candidatus Omnitrophica bacterium]|nr:PilZ domain-containing protein [Candidatus Omnitrophota bacterium]
MNPKIYIEKRRYPRVKQVLPLNLAINGYDISTTTKDISCIGAYCHVDRYIPPFTKILVRLNLPISDTRDNNCIVECKGVVVRTEDQAQGFNIAIFFNEITENQKNKIFKYISQFLPK